MNKEHIHPQHLDNSGGNSGGNSAAEEDPFAADIDMIASITAVTSILGIVCRTTGVGFSAVSRVTEDRWIACAVRDEVGFGLLPGSELSIKSTFCDEIRSSGKLVVMDHASKDALFCNHPLPKMYGFESYISVPIVRPNGNFFGTLCALDPNPVQLNKIEIVSMFERFAELIAFHLDAQERIHRTERALLSERQTAQLREQFFAILSHDLRNPVSSISSGADLLLRSSLPERAESIAGVIKRSAARMNGMIENTLDFARTRLGGGLSICLVDDAAVGKALEQIIAEARAVWPKREITCKITLDQAVCCDAERIAQMFSNLLTNALTHGEPISPVWIQVDSSGEGFRLSVANLGEPIPPEVLSRLFEPYSRDAARPNRKGLGLGLYIAAEIAKAHHGTLDVISSSTETRFTFYMPTRTKVISVTAMA